MIKNYFLKKFKKYKITTKKNITILKFKGNRKKNSGYNFKLIEFQESKNKIFFASKLSQKHLQVVFRVF